MLATLNTQEEFLPKAPHLIHVNLCIALLLEYVLFVGGIFA